MGDNTSQYAIFLPYKPPLQFLLALIGWAAASVTRIGGGVGGLGGLVGLTLS